MTDIHEGEFGRFKIIKPKEFGELIRDWALGATPPPKTISELREALEGPDPIALVPTRWEDKKKITVVQPEADEFILRLPPKKMLKNTLDELAGVGSAAEYDVPGFYKIKLRGQTDGQESKPSNDHLSNLDFFLCRVSDYTVSVCR